MIMRHLLKHPKQFSWFSLFGILLAGMSLFSLAERIFQFGVSQLLVDVVGYYRDFAALLFGWVSLITPLSIPAMIYDCWLLSGICSSAIIRSDVKELKEIHLSTVLFYAFLILSNFLLIPLLRIIVAALQFLPRRIARDPSRNLEILHSKMRSRILIYEFLLGVGAFLAIFIVNAYAPSVSS